MCIHMLPVAMGIEHSVRTNLLEFICKLNILVGIKQTGKKEGKEKDSNSKTEV